MRLACGNQLSPTQNLMGNGMQASAKNQTAGAYLPSDNPTSLVGWFRMGVGVTVTGAGVSTWADQSGNGHDLLQAVDAKRPAYDGSAIITFDGTSDFLKCVSFTLAQPQQVSLLVNPITWTDQDRIFDANTANHAVMFQNTSTPTIKIYSLSSVVAANTNLTLGSFHAATVLFAGASSSITVDNTAPTTGNPGAGSLSGFTLGASASGGSPSNIAVKEIILRNVDDATIRANDHAYLQTF